MRSRLFALCWISWLRSLNPVFPVLAIQKRNLEKLLYKSSPFYETGQRNASKKVCDKCKPYGCDPVRPTSQVAGTPTLHDLGFEKILLETLNNVGHH